MGGAKLNIVVTDADTDFRRQLKAVLEFDGHRVTEAANGGHTMAQIRAHRPSLIIAAADLPDMTGDQLFERVKELDVDFQVIAFIFLSPDIGESHAIARLNRGADGVFVKPVNLTLLLAHANACLLNADRHAKFIEAKLERLTHLLVVDKPYSFDYKLPISENLNHYLDNLQRSIKKLPSERRSHHHRANAKPPLTEDSRSSLAYIRFCLDQLNRQRALVSTLNAEALTWWLIFTVAESQYAGKTLFVSDLYFSTPSAKTTIVSRINQLIEKAILAKRSHPTDGRRQQIILGETFEATFSRHVGESLDLLGGVMS